MVRMRHVVRPTERREPWEIHLHEELSQHLLAIGEDVSIFVV